MSLRYLESDGVAFVFDPQTVKLFRLEGERRIEINDPCTRARVLTHAVRISEQEAETLAEVTDFAAKASWAGM